MEQNEKGLLTDGWVNVLAGLGKLQDKSVQTEFGHFEKLLDDQLTAMYLADGIGRKIVDVVADDMTRQWIEVENDPEEKIKKQLSELGAEENFNEALKWNRLYGGSIIIFGIMDGKALEKPVNLNAVQGVEWLYVTDRTKVFIETSEFDTDPKSKTFGQIQQYDVEFNFASGQDIKGSLFSSAGNRRKVHASRVVSFFGESVPRSASGIDSTLRYWGSSVIQIIWEKLRDYGGVTQSIVNLMYELIIGVFSFEGLADMLAQGNEAQVINRMEIINMTKSIINAVLLGENEKFDRNSASLTGAPEIIDRFMMNLSAVANIPVTKLFGRSPAGQNATGESDMTNYYDGVKSDQKNKLLKPLQKLVNLIAMDEEEHQVVFNPLVQMTEKEIAEIEKLESESYNTKATGDKTYIEMGVLTSEEVTEQRFPDTMELEDAE